MEFQAHVESHLSEGGQISIQADSEFILNTVRAVLWRADVQPLRFTYVSPQVETMLGIRAQDFYDNIENWTAAIHADDRQQAVDHMASHAKQGQDHTVEYRFKHPDGRTLWIEDTLKIVPGPNGVTMVGVMVDITARRQREQQALEHVHQADDLESKEHSRALFAAIVNHSVGLMVYYNSQETPIYISPSAQAILGWDLEALKALPAPQWLHPDDFPAAARRRAQVVTGQLVNPRNVMRFLCADGSYKRLRTSYIKLPPGGLIEGYLLYAEDAEAALHAEEQLRDSDTLHRSIVENSWDLVAVIGVDGRIEQASPSMAAAFELPIENLMGRGLARLAVAADRPRFDLMLAKAMSQRPIERDQDIRLQLPHGPHLYEVRLRHLGEDRDGRVLFNARDVQGERESQAQILQYQRLAVFGQLAAGFAHEVRNPLAGILGAAQLALRRSQAGQDDSEQLQVVLRQVERLRLLMDDILHRAKGPHLDPALVDPAEALKKAAESAQQQFGPGRENIKVEFDIQNGNARVQVTEDRLLRLLHNLVLNALQALPPQGGRLALGVELKGGDVLLTVQDNGPGLSEDAALRAFEPFFTTKPTGSGLGLWIAQSLCQEMGGRLSLATLKPHGAAFTLTLPVA